MLKTRILTAAVVLPLFLLALLYLQNVFWAAFLLALAVIGSREWCNLAGFSVRNTIIFMILTTLIGGELLFQLSDAAETDAYTKALMGIYVLSAFFWVGYVPFQLKQPCKITNVLALMMIGWLILIPTVLALYQLRAISPMLLLGFMGTIWISDTAAYFAGRAFGRRKLAYHISPGKTWEGVAGAMLAVMIYALIWVFVFADGAYVGTLIPLLIILATLGIMDDLFESLIKRQAGVKDSGSILPGHGGILDRIDALTAALPVAILAVQIFNSFQP